ncbi:hypothetical protein GJAV_G00039130 [Gymnothorax javanicus]|nr:hypothetical protein GJAV_G00039130 [Gymnothorax javanicus]
MERGCRGTEVIQCEEHEITALHKEENQVVLILLDHFRATRRQECLSRVATAFLLLSCLAVFLFFHVSPQPVEAAHGNDVERHHQHNGGPHARPQLGKPDVLPHAHLTVLPPPTRPTPPKCNPMPDQKTLAWEAVNGLAYTHIFAYVQQKRALIVPVAGFYTVYLQMTFRIPDGYVSDHASCRLGAVVFATWDDEETQLMRLWETMPCGEPSRKSVFVSGIFLLKKNTELRVNVTNFTNITLVDRFSETNTFFGASLSFQENA